MIANIFWIADHSAQSFFRLFLLECRIQLCLPNHESRFTRKNEIRAADLVAVWSGRRALLWRFAGASEGDSRRITHNIKYASGAKQKVPTDPARFIYLRRWDRYSFADMCPISGVELYSTFIGQTPTVIGTGPQKTTLITQKARCESTRSEFNWKDQQSSE